MTDPGRDVEIPYSRWKMAKGLLFSLPMLLAAVGMIYAGSLGPPRPSPNADLYMFILQVCGFLLLAIPLYFGGRVLRAMIRRPRGMIIAVAGVTTPELPGPAITIPWQEVLGFASFKQNRAHHVVIGVETPDHYFDTFGGWFWRYTARANTRRWGSPFVVPLALLSEPVEAVVEKLQAGLDTHLQSTDGDNSPDDPSSY